MKKILHCAIIALILAFILTACGNSSAAETTVAPTELDSGIAENVLPEESIVFKKAEPDVISIESVEYITTGFSRTIEVKFRNMGDVSMESITLYVDLLDEDGDVLGQDYLFFYSLLEPGQAATETVWIDEEKNPSSIRIARGDYFESGTDTFVDFTFDPYFMSECAFDAVEEPAEGITYEDTKTQEVTDVSETIENGEFTFTAAEFIDYLYYALPADYFIASADYPGSEIVGTMILNGNMDEQMQFLIFDADGNYIDPSIDDTAKIDCIGALHFFDTEYREDDLSLEENYYSAVSICDPSYDYESFCDTLNGLKNFPGSMALLNGIEYWFEETDSFDVFWICPAD